MTTLVKKMLPLNVYARSPAHPSTNFSFTKVDSPDVKIDLYLLALRKSSNFGPDFMYYYFKIEGTDFEFPFWRPLYLIGKEGRFQIISGDNDIDPHTFKTYNVPENTAELAICASGVGKIHPLALFTDFL